MAVLFSSWLVSLANLIGLRYGVLERRRYIVFAVVLYLYGLFKSFEGSYMYMYPPPLFYTTYHASVSLYWRILSIIVDNILSHCVLDFNCSGVARPVMM
jgi:hypothetical protein